MFDTRKALQDMANQIRACRAEDGLTLQQLATQSGVAASTIHKVEAQQMVPTVSVFLKIARGLGRRPDQLIRDRSLEGETQTSEFASEATCTDSFEQAPRKHKSAGKNDLAVWRIQLAAQQALPALELASQQRAIFLVERGRITLQSGERRVHIAAGNCIEFEGGTIQSPSAQLEEARITLIVTPPGNLEARLGPPAGTGTDCDARPSVQASTASLGSA